MIESEVTARINSQLAAETHKKLTHIFYKISFAAGWKQRAYSGTYDRSGFTSVHNFPQQKRSRE